jgi:hypothetical protein
VQWLKGNKPQSLIDEIKDSMRIINEANDVSFTSNSDLLIDALADKVDHHYPFDHDVFHDFFRKALIEQFKNDQLLEPSKLLPSLKKICDEHNAIKNKYILVTSINLDKKYKLKSRVINGIKVSFYNSVPKKYAKERTRLFEKYKTDCNLTERDDYQFCTISITAPDPTTAYIKAAQTLDIIRSLMQIGFKKNINILAFDKENEYPTKSIITLGKYHSLHFPTGKTALQALWYEDPYQEKEATKIRHFIETQTNVQKQIQFLKNSIFKDHVIDALTSYIEALYQHDVSIKFLKLWAVLEQLVNSDDTKKITIRISFFFEQRESVKSIIESLRMARNIHVHKGRKPRNIEIKNFKLCHYIELLINFFLKNPFKHKDLESAIEFMSTSTDIEEINKKIKLLKEVKEFLAEVKD